jgi:ribosomal protein L40E
MTKETIGYVRLEWTCPNCGSKNPGPQKTCTNCGAAQPEGLQFQQAAQEKLITEEKEIDRAKTGPDIHCGYCGARNPATAENCSQCGADLREGRARESGRVLGAHRAKTAPDVPCPSCGALNPATALECSQCGASMARPEPQPVARPAASGSRLSCGTIAAILGGAAVLILAVVFILGSRTKDVVGRVQEVSWKRSIAIEALGPVEHEDWRTDVPSQASILSCDSKVHHTQEQAAPNAEKVCGTPYTVDTGSGYGEVVQDCMYEVYADWCKYTVEEWKAADVSELEGQDLAPRWPALQLAADQREGQRDESYKCVFNVDGKILSYAARDVDDFQRCEIGSRWTLEVNTFNHIVSIAPAN